MNGVVFHTSAMMIPARAGFTLPVHRIEVPKILLAMPSKAKMKNHSLAVTAVGMAHGTRTEARSRPRPRKVRAMMTAIPNPSAVSRITVATAKKNVVPMELQNCAPRFPGGHGTCLLYTSDAADDLT